MFFHLLDLFEHYSIHCVFNYFPFYNLLVFPLELTLFILLSGMTQNKLISSFSAFGF